MVRSQISVHTRLQLEIGPPLLTDPLCQTDERDDAGKKSKKADQSPVVCLRGLKTVLNVKYLGPSDGQACRS